MNIFIEPTFIEYYTNHPLVLVDVGASGGLQSNWKHATKYIQIIGFEPDEREYLHLHQKENDKVKYFNTALYDKKTVLDFLLTKKQQTSSIYKPNFSFLEKFPEIERFNIVGLKKLNADTLDNVFDYYSINEADFIKLDTQGSELSILRGSSKTIDKHIFGIEVEVEFVELYKNQPLFADVDNFLRKKGFYLFDLQRAYWKRNQGIDCYRKKGQLVFGNALYLKKTDRFIKMIDDLNNFMLKKSKVLNAISICLLYGYVDYAIEIFNAKKNIFSTDESEAITKNFKKKVFLGNKIPQFKGKGKIANLFYSIGDIFHLSNTYWSTSDSKLGNK